MPDTRPDPLAALLHDVAVEAYRLRRWAQAPWPTDLYEFVADRIRSAGVTLTQPQPEHAFHDEWRFQRAMGRKYPGNDVAGDPIAPDQPCFDCGIPFAQHITQPQPDAELRHRFSPLGCKHAHGRVRDNHDCTYCPDCGRWQDDIVREHGYPDEDDDRPTDAALRSTPAAPATASPTEQTAPHDGSAVAPLDVERLSEALSIAEFALATAVNATSDDRTWWTTAVSAHSVVRHAIREHAALGDKP